jgi:hypothetical protein
VNRVAIALSVLALTAPLELRAVANPCQTPATAFVRNPNQATFVALSRFSDSACWTVIDGSNLSRNSLNRRVRSGNRWAAQYSAQHLKMLDGGNLEDALVALGQFGDRNMEGLLLLGQQGSLNERELTDALTMLPVSLSDNPNSQLTVVRARKAKAVNVSRTDLAKQQTAAIQALDDFAAEIKATQKNSER